MIKLYVSIWWAKAAHSDNYKEVVVLLSCSCWHHRTIPAYQTNFWQIPRRGLIFVETAFFFKKRLTSHFSTECCYIIPIKLSNIPVAMAVLNVYCYSLVELQKHTLHPQLSCRLTPLWFVGVLWQKLHLHSKERVRIFAFVLLFTKRHVGIQVSKPALEHLLLKNGPLLFSG